MGTGEFNAGVTLRWTSIPSMGEYKYSQSLHICYKKRDKLRPDGPLGSDADLAFFFSTQSKRFFSGYSGFPSPQKPTFLNSNLILECMDISERVLVNILVLLG